MKMIFHQQHVDILVTVLVLLMPRKCGWVVMVVGDVDDVSAKYVLEVHTLLQGGRCSIH